MTEAFEGVGRGNESLGDGRWPPCQLGSCRWEGKFPADFQTSGGPDRTGLIIPKHLEFIEFTCYDCEFIHWTGLLSSEDESQRKRAANVVRSLRAQFEEIMELRKNPQSLSYRGSV